MYSKEKILEILEAYDLTKSLRSAAALVGCDHHTVARFVAARAAGLDPAAGGARPSVSEPFVDKIHEWVDRSEGRIRADVVHEKLVAMGYPGSERTTRRVVAVVKEQWRRQSHRVYMPWITEPGLWLQWDYAAGPLLGGQRVVLFVAWLAWSRFRVVVPLRDRTMPSVIAALDATFRRLGGAPTFALTDNEKTVTDRHIAGIAVRNPQIVAVAHYYGVSIATCVPADPESKGGSESTVRLAKADLVPAEHNLLAGYESWDQLVAACDAFMDTVNERVHRAIGVRPVERLEIERGHLHPVPVDPFTAAFGETRAVGWSSTLNHRGARYSVPHDWVDQRVWVRVEGDALVVVATPPSGPVEVARHRLVGPGQVSIDPAHYPQRRSDPLHREPKARTAAEAAFLTIGPGAAAWLVEAAGSGARGIEHKMREAVELTKVFDPAAVDRALGQAAITARFAAGDLLSILSTPTPTSATTRASENHSLQPGTAPWRQIGLPADKGPQEPAHQHRRGRRDRDRRSTPMAPRLVRLRPRPRWVDAPVQLRAGQPDRDQQRTRPLRLHPRLAAMTTSQDTVLAEIDRLCRRLRMPYIRRNAADVVATAKAQRWDPAEIVRVLLEEEAAGRDASTIEVRRRKAAFPAGKTFDTFDPARFSIPAPTQQALASLEWIHRRENLVVAGPSGTGKSHFCEALGHAAINANLTVTWFSVEQLGSLVARHRIDDTITKALKPVLRSDLVIVDDIGLLPITNDAAEGLYRLIDAAYERRSVAISSNLHPSGFDELMPRTIATALVDRLMHHAHVLVTTGDSVRLTDAAGGKGVKPLT